MRMDTELHKYECLPTELASAATSPWEVITSALNQLRRDEEGRKKEVRDLSVELEKTRAQVTRLRSVLEARSDETEFL